MWIDCLRYRGVRNLKPAELSVGPGLVVLTGDNGAGKTAVLEALMLLNRARSFRSGVASSLIQWGASEAEVFAEVGSVAGGGDRIGVRRSAKSWDARCNGDSVSSLALLVSQTPMAAFHSESSGIVSGASEQRRSCIDWVVFHVEHHSRVLWSRYRRALEGRNRLLREGGSSKELDAWDSVLATQGDALHLARERWVDKLLTSVAEWWSRLSGTGDSLQLKFLHGWPSSLGFRESLFERRSADQDQGYTRYGPHRADIQCSLEGRSAKDVMSRGQQKLLALCFLLAQLELLRGSGQRGPILLLDDFLSEIDDGVAKRALSELVVPGGQVWMSGVAYDASLLPPQTPSTVFHVEQGEVSQLL